VEAGAELLVAGSAVFGGGDAEGAARRLIETCQ
jgi:pentose-5-phosphate-3-epimerase